MSLFKEYMADETFRRLYHQDSLNLEITEAICGFMEERQITRKELAERLGKSKGFVSQVLNGSRNMTLKTLADITFALGCRACLSLEPASAECDVQKPSSKDGSHKEDWKPAKAFKTESKVIPLDIRRPPRRVSVQEMDLAANYG